MKGPRPEDGRGLTGTQNSRPHKKAVTGKAVEPRTATQALGNVGEDSAGGLTGGLLLTVLRRMRQRPGMLDHLGEVADIDAAAAGRALQEMLDLGRRLAADDLAAAGRKGSSASRWTRGHAG
jgi:hypothetical protein